jgi:hypothetical protein
LSRTFTSSTLSSSAKADDPVRRGFSNYRALPEYWMPACAGMTIKFVVA